MGLTWEFQFRWLNVEMIACTHLSKSNKHTNGRLENLVAIQIEKQELGLIYLFFNKLIKETAGGLNLFWLPNVLVYCIAAVLVSEGKIL